MGEAMDETAQALVIGAGPAGLMAAEALSANGVQVIVADAKPSVARKFLMAGKTGLNLTRDRPLAGFIDAYGTSAPRLAPMLAAFGPEEVQAWAQGLGEALFTGTTGRVFPRTMKASPLLRRWLGRLASRGVRIETRWRWIGWRDGAALFETVDGVRSVRAGATVLALGGASWARLGSDGAWAQILAAQGVELAPFAPANAALQVTWSPHIERHFGQPVKGVALTAGGRRQRGEFVISATGLEGGGIYALTAAARAGDPIALDLVPDLSAGELAQRLSRPRGKATVSNHLRKTARLDPARLALAREFGAPLPTEPAALAARLKALPLRHAGPAPIDRAISTAGGVCWAALDGNLQLRALPGVFAAGEMLDWEAPTGGYLLTACLATGQWAGRAAAAALSREASSR